MKKNSIKNKDLWGKKQVFIITANPYNQEIIVVINGQFTDVIKLFKKLGSVGAKLNLEEIEKHKDIYSKKYIHNDGSAFTYTELPKGYVVMVSHQDSWIKTVEGVAHECLHLTHYILKGAGIVLCQESEEAYTYLQGKLIVDILRRMYA